MLPGGAELDRHHAVGFPIAFWTCHPTTPASKVTNVLQAVAEWCAVALSPAVGTASSARPIKAFHSRLSGHYRAVTGRIE